MEVSLQHEFDPSRVSKLPLRSFSAKLKKNLHITDDDNEKNSSGCLGFYGKLGGCKVGIETADEFGESNAKRKSNVADECMGYYRKTAGETRIDCCSSSMAEKLWKKSILRRTKRLDEELICNNVQFSLPDDLLIMCLVRLPMTSLMNARLVCKKWRSIISSNEFTQMRKGCSHQDPCLFLFGIVKDGYCDGLVHALDISVDKWVHTSAEFLKDRYFFSVICIDCEIYIVGGCSSLTNFGKVDKNSSQTHKSVSVFNPTTGLWRKIASMKCARSSPILGVMEADPSCSIFQRNPNRLERKFKSRIDGVSEVYEDPHRLSLRRQFKDTYDDIGSTSESRGNPFKSTKQQSDEFTAERSNKRLVLVVIGGRGSWDEALDSAEIYDPQTNKWIDIPILPSDFGIACSSVACNGILYVYSDSDKLVAYHIERNTWFRIQTTRPPSRLHEYLPKLVCCNNRLFMVCVSWCERDGYASRRERAVRKLWELDLTFLSWIEVSKHPDAPMDWNAVFVAVRDKIFGVEMFKIFGQVLDFLTECNVSDADMKWSRISRKHVAQELDALSCVTKSMAVVYV